MTIANDPLSGRAYVISLVRRELCTSEVLVLKPEPRRNRQLNNHERDAAFFKVYHYQQLPFASTKSMSHFTMGDASCGTQRRHWWWWWYNRWRRWWNWTIARRWDKQWQRQWQRRNNRIDFFVSVVDYSHFSNPCHCDACRGCVVLSSSQTQTTTT